jgi:hypothetical protein
MRTSIFMALVTLPLAACAKNADKITPTYVSPMKYEVYNCRQLAEETQRVSARAAAATGARPSGDKQIAAELGRLRGEIEAIEVASTLKRCGTQTQSAPPPT